MLAHGGRLAALKRQRVAVGIIDIDGWNSIAAMPTRALARRVVPEMVGALVGR